MLASALAILQLLRPATGLALLVLALVGHVYIHRECEIR
jgi:hypothetical protein